MNFGLNSPGPAAYANRSAVGPQTSSRNESAPIYGFGSEERFRYDFVDRAKKIPGRAWRSIQRGAARRRPLKILKPKA